MLFERVLAWWKLGGFQLPSSTAEYLIPEFIDFKDFGVATVELTNKLFDDAEQLIRSVLARPKCCKGIYEEDFQRFQLSLTCHSQSMDGVPTALCKHPGPVQQPVL